MRSILVAGSISQAADSIVCELLEDDRVVLNLSKLEATTAEELKVKILQSLDAAQNNEGEQGASASASAPSACGSLRAMAEG